jgi:hypothetical protein
VSVVVAVAEEEEEEEEVGVGVEEVGTKDGCWVGGVR